MNRTKMNKYLIKNGYVLVRSNKHLIYKHKNKDKPVNMVVLPNHNKLNNKLITGIMRQVEK